MNCLVICDNNQFRKALWSSSKLNNIRYISIFNNKSQNISEMDMYVVLLLVVSQNHKSCATYTSNNTLTKNIVSYLKKMKQPNVQSYQGKKHNQSYGNYYGFGLTNKYKPS